MKRANQESELKEIEEKKNKAITDNKNKTEEALKDILRIVAQIEKDKLIERYNQGENNEARHRHRAQEEIGRILKRTRELTKQIIKLKKNNIAIDEALKEEMLKLTKEVLNLIV